VLTEEKMDVTGVRLDHLPFINLLATLHRRKGFTVSGLKFQVYSDSTRKLQCMSVNILHRCIEYVTTGTISGICCDLGEFCL
jgi:hypothetical protein